MLIVSMFALAQENLTVEDKVKKLLCKSWETEYGEVDGMRFMHEDSAKVFYEFCEDNSFLMKSSHPFDIKKGTWEFDAERNLVYLKIDDKVHTVITSIFRREIAMIVDVKKGFNGLPSHVKLYFKEAASF